MKKRKILYIVGHYPQISQTYIEAELDAIQDECEVRVISLNKPNVAYKNHVECHYSKDPNEICELIDDFQPQLLHSHYLTLADFVANLSRRKNIPFTIRTHSFDSIWQSENPSWRGRIRGALGKLGLPDHAKTAVPAVNDDLCLGILAFPFLRPRLEKAGFHGEKIHDCYPVVHYKRFYDPSPNGRDVMNVGACLPKKGMEDFLKLARLVPDRSFNLYALGYEADNLVQLNERMGQPVRFIPPVEPREMPSEYKKHEWLVYTADRRVGTVGWPVSIAEAQASGVGVCMPNLRPDLKEYVGPAGFLYDSTGEAAEIISKPFPEELRRLGFEHAKKSDVFTHRRLLIDLWRNADDDESPAGYTSQSSALPGPEPL
jgi:hypothetical protein